MLSAATRGVRSRCWGGPRTGSADGRARCQPPSTWTACARTPSGSPGGSRDRGSAASTTPTCGPGCGGELCSRALVVEPLQQVVGRLLDLVVVVLRGALLGVDQRRPVDLGEVAVRERETPLRAFGRVGVDGEVPLGEL